MTWNEVGQWIVSTPEILIPVSFTSRLAIKAADISNLRPTWDWAGFFYQYLEVVPLGQARIDKKINIPTREAVLFTPESFKPSYSLKFIKAGWISSLTLTIYEDSMPLNYTPDADTISIPSPFASVTNSVSVPLATVSSSFLAANPNRKKLIISNNSTQDLYIDLDATASVADHAIKIPKKGASGSVASYELDNYTGIVSGIWGVSGSGAALIREMVQ
ncbi:MAG: hypothetical protein HC764_23720 [Pleurocapsa sp. CRU_1_2]|nr:hypothetical protein [Pleurocapsa sp. CRU_1_2]